MCTYTTERSPVSGSGKGPQRWTALAEATVYFDHPVHAMADHTLNIDLTPAGGTPGERVALELTTGSALDLVEAVVAALTAVPADLAGVDQGRLQALAAALAAGRSGAATGARTGVATPV